MTPNPLALLCGLSLLSYPCSECQEDVVRIYFTEHDPHLTVLKRCIGSSVVVYCKISTPLESHQKAYVHLRTRYVSSSNGHESNSTNWTNLKTKWMSSNNAASGRRTAFVINHPSAPERKATKRMDLACDLQIYDEKTNCSIRYENSSRSASIVWFPCGVKQPHETRLCLWNETVVLECLRADAPLEWSWYKNFDQRSVLNGEEPSSSYAVDSNRLTVQIVDESRLGRYACYGFDTGWLEFYEKAFHVKLAFKPETPVGLSTRRIGETSAWLTWTPVEPAFADAKLERIYSKKSDYFLLFYQTVGGSDRSFVANTTDTHCVLRDLKERTLYRVWLRAVNPAGMSNPVRLMFATSSSN